MPELQLFAYVHPPALALPSLGLAADRIFHATRLFLALPLPNPDPFVSDCSFMFHAWGCMQTTSTTFPVRVWVCDQHYTKFTQLLPYHTCFGITPSPLSPDVICARPICPRHFPSSGCRDDVLTAKRQFQGDGLQDFPLSGAGGSTMFQTSSGGDTSFPSP